MTDDILARTQIFHACREIERIIYEWGMSDYWINLLRARSGNLRTSTQNDFSRQELATWAMTLVTGLDNESHE